MWNVNYKIKKKIKKVEYGEGWVLNRAELVWLFTDSDVAVGCGAEAAVFAKEG